MSTILTVCAIWLLISIILAPIVGGFLRRNRRAYEEVEYLTKHPLPSGSIDRDGLMS
jgi:hypothetical protein